MAFAYYFIELQKAMYARFLSDTGVDGLFPTGGQALVNGIYFDGVPEEAPYPYIEVSVVTSASGIEAGEGFENRSRMLDIQVGLFIQKDLAIGNSSPELLGYWQRMAALMDRVNGDWTEHADRQPSYGLDRWQPTLDSGTFSMNPLVFVEERNESTPDELHYTMTFRAWAHRRKQ